MGASLHDIRKRGRRERREKEEDFRSVRLPLPEAECILGRRDRRSKDTKSGKGPSYTCSLTKNRGNKGRTRSFRNKSSLAGNYWEYIYSMALAVNRYHTSVFMKLIFLYTLLPECLTVRAAK